MRIGIDMLGVQSPHSRGRGIGRLSASLVAAMLRVDRENDYLLYAHHGLPTDDFPRAPNAEVVPLADRPTAAEAIAERADRDPDRLDALVTLSPFELYRDYDPPARPLGGPAAVGFVHDLIPFLFQERYLTWPPIAARFYRNLERLRRYDVLLANSEFTRRDCLRLLGLKPERVAAVLGASDPDYFTPEPPEGDAEAGALLRRFGVVRPFVFCLGSMDERKNLTGLIDAFGMLPASVRDAHQLVLTFAISEGEAEALRRHAASRGIEGGRLVLTGGLPDEGIRALYRRCTAFAHPSHYEGLGLPLLEAMLCGAPVLAGQNSSQVEVVGDAGLLANSADATEVAEKLGLLLTDGVLAARLGRAGRERARTFRWETSAERSVEAIARAVERSRPARPRRVRRDAPAASRPRLAVFSPWPPKRSGIADYALRLAGELAGRYEVDLYHDPGYVPEVSLGGSDYRAIDARLFRRNARTLGYRGVLYQMGNSAYHRWVYDAMLDHPGVVTLHDYNLAGFHFWYSHFAAAEPGHFRREVEHSEGRRAAEIVGSLEAWSGEPGGLADACARREIALNRRVFERSRAVVLHSATFARRAGAEHPEFAERVRLIPLGADPAPADPADRRATRERLGLPADGLILGCFGILHPTKMNAETLEAFARVAAERPGVSLVFVGRDIGHEPVPEQASALGLTHRVRFFGHLPADDYAAMLGAVDLGISLRRPPTNGETSAALLDLLRRGVPTIVTDTGSFADYPDAAVRKVCWERDGLDGLVAALADLIDRPDRRESLGREAVRLVGEVHAWRRVADLYAALIEEQAGATDRPVRHAAPTLVRGRRP